MNSTNKLTNILGIITGVLSIMFAAVMKFGTEYGSYCKRESYGGDAYTGIQNAAAQTATNTYYVAGLISLGFAMLLFIIGLALILHFAGKLAQGNSIPPSYAAPTYSYSETSPAVAPVITETTYPDATTTARDDGWVCLNCASHNPSEAMFCKGCGIAK